MGIQSQTYRFNANEFCKKMAGRYALMAVVILACYVGMPLVVLTASNKISDPLAVGMTVGWLLLLGASVFFGGFDWLKWISRRLHALRHCVIDLPTVVIQSDDGGRVEFLVPTGVSDCINLDSFILPHFSAFHGWEFIDKSAFLSKDDTEMLVGLLTKQEAKTRKNQPPAGVSPSDSQQGRTNSAMKIETSNDSRFTTKPFDARVPLLARLPEMLQYSAKTKILTAIAVVSTSWALYYFWRIGKEYFTDAAHATLLDFVFLALAAVFLSVGTYFWRKRQRREIPSEATCTITKNRLLFDFANGTHVTIPYSAIWRVYELFGHYILDAGPGVFTIPKAAFKNQDEREQFRSLVAVPAAARVDLSSTQTLV